MKENGLRMSVKLEARLSGGATSLSAHTQDLTTSSKWQS